MIPRFYETKTGDLILPGNVHLHPLASVTSVKYTPGSLRETLKPDRKCREKLPWNDLLDCISIILPYQPQHKGQEK